MANPAKILVLDDDPDIRNMLLLILAYYNYTVVEAATEQNALDALASEKIGLVIMDMLLSGANGSDVCARIKQDPQTAHIPILMISAHPNGKEFCLQAGADDFIAKPFEMAELLGKIEKLVERGEWRDESGEMIDDSGEMRVEL